MQFIGMEPLEVSEEHIEITSGAVVYDLHNIGRFIEYSFDVQTDVLLLTFLYESDGIRGTCDLRFVDVRSLRICSRDPEMPKSEDQCLEYLKVLDDGAELKFWNGIIFEVVCSEMVFVFEAAS
jgi:hypothetical protein